MKKSPTGPTPTKGTKQNERQGHALPKNKGYTKEDGVPIVKKKGIHPLVSKHKFLSNKREYC